MGENDQNSGSDNTPSQPNLFAPDLNLSPITRKNEEEDDLQLRWDHLNVQHVANRFTLHSWVPKRGSLLHLLERIALWIERPANRLIGSDQLNPFYHTGTIATLLLIIIGLTGFYLYLFYKYGFDVSYEDVLTRIEGPFIARTIRAIHRYASGALIITTLLHAYRILFMERFRGPRWLAWISGIVMTIVLWFAGVTGYWLIWDQRAQLINDSFVNFLQTLTPFAASYMVMITEADISGISWPLFLSVFGLHLLMFLIAGLFFYLHIKRLNRPKWLPPPYWTVGVGIVVLIVGLLFPLGMLPKGNLEQLPGPVTIDPFFLFYLPAGVNPVWSWVLWISIGVILIVSTALPWLRFRDRDVDEQRQEQEFQRPLVRIIQERCTGCTLCVVDCPYNAIEMVERTDGKRHKYVAVGQPDLCVSCGICVGSCDFVAVTLGDAPPEAMWYSLVDRINEAQARSAEKGVALLLTCERHAAQGAAPYLDQPGQTINGLAIEVITFPCVGTMPPQLLAKTLQAGADEVHVIGCPADDCTNREGNLWTEQRLVRERVPRLRRDYVDDPIFAHWVPPNSFNKVFENQVNFIDSRNEIDEDYSPNLEQRRILKNLNWTNYLVAFALLAGIMVLQVLLSDLPFQRYPVRPVMTQAIVADIAQPIRPSSYISSLLGPQLELNLSVDEQIVYRELYETADLLSPGKTPFYFEYQLEPATYHLRLILLDQSNKISFTLFDQSVALEAGQIFRYGN